MPGSSTYRADQPARDPARMPAGQPIPPGPHGPAQPGSLRGIILNGFQHIEPNIVAVSIAGAVMMPAYWMVWTFLFPQAYENLPMRLAGSALCLSLVFRRRWPGRLQAATPVVWLLMLGYCLPFFFTFMTVMNGGSVIWQMSTLTALFLLVLLVDWFSLIILFILGTSLGILAALITGPPSHDMAIYAEYAPILAFGLLGGAIFNYNAANSRAVRERALAESGRTAGRMVQTPLMSIRTSARSLETYLPGLVRSHRIARAQGVPVESFDDAHLEALLHVPARIDEDCADVARRLQALGNPADIRRRQG
ncbi:hypothetical protein GCM10011505_00480 [Tistrella bauzanensis]|uniref:CAI-1 autoinducer sensor kinase/phosphatase cqsS n=1 Tax=Tistrella bauzanensis TaxID=657419 RepID=A0ABQ1I700_9PROT|nr:CAI-1 autoinducer sensor kinase/phosphatase cqsS [Tistrella bauzanensis]GGB23167.1 hypothetical protein GCM10011505_00480 [Tistrella bauzanensis]